MQNKFKKGDKVKLVVDSVDDLISMGICVKHDLLMAQPEGVIVDDTDSTPDVDFGVAGTWFINSTYLQAVKVAKPKVAKPSVVKPKVAKPTMPKPKKARSRLSLAHVLTLYPQTRKVLAHMEQHGDISPLEAFGVYRITRLAARINEIRDAGVEVATTMKRDATGTRYASYSLI